MSILKFILFALVLFGLWVTEPIWSNIGTPATTSPALPVDETVEETIDVPADMPVNRPVMEQKQTKNDEVNVESRFLKELEVKIGPRPSVKESTGVPSPVYIYWRKTLKYPDSLQEETCGPVRGSEEGWTTVCRYKTENSSYELELREDRFVIRNGTAYKK
ncbi:MAG TPA: hypothetical protein VIM88_05640 [Sulfurovum sp.]|uniref:hypothetical protein n=1 Tax=Sulfurovum sp. TaxID=1969726 RepID=UPI002F95EBC5